MFMTMSPLFTVFFVVGSAWLGVNLLHWAWVETRRHFWEKRFLREPSGLLPEAAAYRIGNGAVALLFIHGFADTPCLWRRITRQLAANDAFTCRAMRLPGSAEPAAQTGRQTLALWRAQVADELVRLRETHETVWVVGHSLGGALALDAALRLPGLVDGVAVLAPLIDVSRKRCPLLPPRLWFGLARVALCLSPTFESPFSADGTAEDDPSFSYTRDRFIPFSVYRALFRLIRANRDQAARLTCPLFAVTAGRDSVVDSAAARRWLAACPEPKEIRDLPETGHVIPLAPGWDKLFNDFAAFVHRHDKAEKESL
jgi:carboxylesterase